MRTYRNRSYGGAAANLGSGNLGSWQDLLNPLAAIASPLVGGIVGSDAQPYVNAALQVLAPRPSPQQPAPATQPRQTVTYGPPISLAAPPVPAVVPRSQPGHWSTPAIIAAAVGGTLVLGLLFIAATRRR